MKSVVYVGRFQPLHKGHVHVIKDILSNFDRVIIVIGSGTESYTEKNPFTGGERLEMILETFNEVSDGQLIVIPVKDINYEFLWYRYLDSLLPHYDYVATSDPVSLNLTLINKKKIYSIKPFKRDIYKGKYVRELMATGKPWKDLVDYRVARIIEVLDGVERIRKIYKRKDDL